MIRKSVMILLMSTILLGCTSSENQVNSPQMGDVSDAGNSSRSSKVLSTPPLPQNSESSRKSPLNVILLDYVANQGRNFDLIKAAADSSLKDASDCLAKGADPSFVIGDYSALHIAVLKNDPKMLALLIPKASNIDVVRPSSGMTPLMEAAYYPRIECLEVLLKAGSSLSAQSQRGFTVLDISTETMRLSNKNSLIFNKSKKIHELLLKDGAKSAVKK